jgi:hypothetical protein
MLEADPIAEAEKSSIKSYHWSELEQLPQRRYLIKGLIDKGGMSVFYGPSNSGKTFVCIDVALHIAHGWNWCGLKTRQGKVVYIAGEGGIGIGERLKAFRKHHGLKEYADFHLIPENIVFCGESAQPFDLIDLVNEIGGVELVVIDTLARAMAGGDENGPKDMGQFIQNCDHIRHETGAHVMVVHHTGKDVDRGARGHSCLKGAIDNEIKVEQLESGVIQVSDPKQRDAKKGNIYQFELKEWEIGKDEDGDPVTSCALQRIEVTEQAEKLTGQPYKARQILLDLIIDEGVDHVPKPQMKPQKCVKLDVFKDHFTKAGICDTDKPDSVDKAFNRSRQKLKSLGYIAEWDGYIWLTDKPDKLGHRLVANITGSDRQDTPL